MKFFIKEICQIDDLKIEKSKSSLNKIELLFWLVFDILKISLF